MKKIDLHIHTKWTKLDPKPKFEFSQEALDKHVDDNGLDIIAITNHNIFDMLQYKSIKERLKPKCQVYPGIEVSLKYGHILIISNPNNLIAFNEFSETIKKRFNENNFIDDEELVDLVKDGNYLIIPHYKKKPICPKITIEKFGEGIIFCGEVVNAKKFSLMQKDEKENLTPVMFSDFRCKDESNIKESKLSSTKYIYLKGEANQFNTVFNLLKSKKNVALNYFDLPDVFEIDGGKILASERLNVLIGRRSSGKTFTLDNIFKSYCNDKNVLYIKQFEITKDCSSDRYDTLRDNENHEIYEKYFEDFRSIVYFMLNINLKESIERADNFVTSLKEHAIEQRTKDAFSCAKLFSEEPFSRIEVNEYGDLLEAVTILMDSIHNELIEKYIKREDLRNLGMELLKLNKKEFMTTLVEGEVNKILIPIKNQLKVNTSDKAIGDFDICELFENKYCVYKFDQLVQGMKDKIIKDEIIGDKYHSIYKILKIQTKKQLNSNFNKNGFGNVLKLSPYKRIEYMQNNKEKFGIEETQIYKAFFYLLRETTDENNGELSGGQKAEYSLITKLINVENYDMVLIDEMESSFDNPFLNEYIINRIQKISDKAIVFISTHNNNLGVSINPDWYIYTDFEKDEGSISYKAYYGGANEIELKTNNDEKIRTKDVLVKYMEASDKAYSERKEIYENIKD